MQWWSAIDVPGALAVVGSAGGLAALAGGVAHFVATRVANDRDAKLKHARETELSTHRDQLERASEAVRSKFRRELTEFAHFAEQKHEAIRSVYAGMLAAARKLSPQPLAAGEEYGPDLYERADASHRLAAQAHQDWCLYLPDPVEQAAARLRDCIADLAVESFSDGRPSATRTGAARRSVESALSELQRQCREHLQALAATPPAASPQTTLPAP